MNIAEKLAEEFSLRIEQAEKRRKDIEMQLSQSKYGIAYIDGTVREYSSDEKEYVGYEYTK